jgi:glycosyltransferase involved in cell wall biosynthesis
VKRLIISPSGNFYGSEQVLFDWLKVTSLKLDLAVPANSQFLDIIKKAGLNHKIITFNGSQLGMFYFSIFRKLLFGHYDLIYLNEAGHIRYISLLSSLFPGKKFIVHVRMLEDVDPSRWYSRDRKNIEVLAISKYIAAKLPVSSNLVYDSYKFQKYNIADNNLNMPELRIGIIGRITRTKGLGLLPELIHQLKNDDPQGKYLFLLFGDISEEIKSETLLEELKNMPGLRFMGFVESKEALFGSIDCVLHLSRQEALGRIFFEAIDFMKPLVGFKSAGIGEIGSLLNLNSLLADPDSKDSIKALAALFISLRLHYQEYLTELKAIRPKAIELFNPSGYVNLLDKKLSA